MANPTSSGGRNTPAVPAAPDTQNPQNANPLFRIWNFLNQTRQENQQKLMENVVMPGVEGAMNRLSYLDVIPDYLRAGFALPRAISEEVQLSQGIVPGLPASASDVQGASGTPIREALQFSYQPDWDKLLNAASMGANPGAAIGEQLAQNLPGEEAYEPVSSFGMLGDIAFELGLGGLNPMNLLDDALMLGIARFGRALRNDPIGLSTVQMAAQNPRGLAGFMDDLVPGLGGRETSDTSIYMLSTSRYDPSAPNMSTAFSNAEASVAIGPKGDHLYIHGIVNPNADRPMDMLRPLQGTFDLSDAHQVAISAQAAAFGGSNMERIPSIELLQDYIKHYGFELAPTPNPTRMNIVRFPMPIDDAARTAELAARNARAEAIWGALNEGDFNRMVLPSGTQGQALVLDLIDGAPVVRRQDGMVYAMDNNFMALARNTKAGQDLGDALSQIKATGFSNWNNDWHDMVQGYFDDVAGVYNWELMRSDLKSRPMAQRSESLARLIDTLIDSSRTIVDDAAAAGLDPWARTSDEWFDPRVPQVAGYDPAVPLPDAPAGAPGAIPDVPATPASAFSQGEVAPGVDAWWSSIGDRPGDADRLRQHFANQPRTLSGGFKGLARVDEIIGLPGGSDEHLRFAESAHDQAIIQELAESMRNEGYRDGNAIMIWVEQDGKPIIAEGNHRIRAAQLAGLTEVPIDVRYFGGSDANDAAWKPRALQEYLNDGTLDELARQEVDADLGNLAMGRPPDDASETEWENWLSSIPSFNPATKKVGGMGIHNIRAGMADWINLNDYTTLGLAGGRNDLVERFSHVLRELTEIQDSLEYVGVDDVRRIMTGPGGLTPAEFDRMSQTINLPAAFGERNGRPFGYFGELVDDLADDLADDAATPPGRPRPVPEERSWEEFNEQVPGGEAADEALATPEEQAWLGEQASREVEADLSRARVGESGIIDQLSGGKGSLLLERPELGLEEVEALIRDVGQSTDPRAVGVLERLEEARTRLQMQANRPVADVVPIREGPDPDGVMHADGTMSSIPLSPIPDFASVGASGMVVHPDDYNKLVTALTGSDSPGYIHPDAVYDVNGLIDVSVRQWLEAASALPNGRGRYADEILMNLAEEAPDRASEVALGIETLQWSLRSEQKMVSLAERMQGVVVDVRGTASVAGPEGQRSLNVMQTYARNLEREAAGVIDEAEGRGLGFLEPMYDAKAKLDEQVAELATELETSRLAQDALPEPRFEVPGAEGPSVEYPVIGAADAPAPVSHRPPWAVSPAMSRGDSVATSLALGMDPPGAVDDLIGRVRTELTVDAQPSQQGFELALGELWDEYEGLHRDLRIIPDSANANAREAMTLLSDQIDLMQNALEESRTLAANLTESLTRIEQAGNAAPINSWGLMQIYGRNNLRNMMTAEGGVDPFAVETMLSLFDSPNQPLRQYLTPGAGNARAAELEALKNLGLDEMGIIHLARTMDADVLEARIAKELLLWLPPEAAQSTANSLLTDVFRWMGE